MEKEFDFNSVGKRMPYRVPDNFFTHMEERVMQQLAEEKLPPATAPTPQRKSTVRIMLRTAMAVAASLALLFTVQALWPKQTEGDFDSVVQAFNYLSDDDQEYLLATYEIEEEEELSEI